MTKIVQMVYTDPRAGMIEAVMLIVLGILRLCGF